MRGEILILTGPPGAGKTTLAQRLARRPGGRRVHLHSDDFWGWIGTGRLDPWLPEADAQNQAVMTAIAGAAAGFAAGGCQVVLDGVIRPAMLGHFRRIPVPITYVVLRPALAESLARCAARGGDTLTDPDPITALHAEFADLGPHEHHVFDIAGLDPDASLTAVLAACDDGGFRLAQGADR